MAWYFGLLAKMFGNAAKGEMSEIREERKERKKKRQTVQVVNSGVSKNIWRWVNQTGLSLVVPANTKSEARAKIKELLGIDRLPVGAKLVKA